MRKIFLAMGCAVLLGSTAGQVQAAPISFSWTDTVSASSTLTAGVSVGDSFTFTIVVDNGGATTVSQIWTGADFVSASINVNGGAYTGIATNITDSLGAFQTDAASSITSVATSWTAIPGNGVDSNGLTGIDWFINGFNGIWLRSPEFDMDIFANNPSGNLNPINWSIGNAPSSVPEPSTWLLFGAGLAMAGIRRWNHARS